MFVGWGMFPWNMECLEQNQIGIIPHIQKHEIPIGMISKDQQSYQDIGQIVEHIPRVGATRKCASNPPNNKGASLTGRSCILQPHPHLETGTHDNLRWLAAHTHTHTHTHLYAIDTHIGAKSKFISQPVGRNIPNDLGSLRLHWHVFHGIHMYCRTPQNKTHTNYSTRKDFGPVTDQQTAGPLLPWLWCFSVQSQVSNFYCRSFDPYLGPQIWSDCYHKHP